MKKLSALSLLFLISFFTLVAHPWKPRHFIIIDTDGGIDDFRAISMLLASTDVRVLGITVTPGALPGEEAYRKVKSLLYAYHHEGIPVGLNEAPEIKPAGFSMARDFSWGAAIENCTFVSSDNVLNYIYSNSRDSIKFVCLGSLNVIKKASRIKFFKGKTAGIIWSTGNIFKEECFNNSIDKDAFKTATKLEIPIRLVNGKSVRSTVFNTTFSEELSKIPVEYAKGVNGSINLPHKLFYDEIIPLWLHFPQFFSQTENGKINELAASVNDADVQQAYYKILSGETVNQNQVINFSWRKEDYFPDVQPIMDETVKKYGKTEWIAQAMANELHRHLGVFAIVGTKMGIRAKEYFNAGIDEMKIVSYAGSIPPFSCMNDGLQVSTGATVGHGLISVAADSVVRPVADFSYMGRTIRVSLKPEYGKKIASEVKELNAIHGLNSDIYWELIRRLAIKYWASFNRHEIFTIEEINSPFIQVKS